MTDQEQPWPSDYLECPCCGGTAAIADEEGYYHDGDETICGCVGFVVACHEGIAYISGDCERKDEH